MKAKIQNNHTSLNRQKAGKMASRNITSIKAARTDALKIKEIILSWQDPRTIPAQDETEIAQHVDDRYCVAIKDEPHLDFEKAIVALSKEAKSIALNMEMVSIAESVSIEWAEDANTGAAEIDCVTVAGILIRKSKDDATEQRINWKITKSTDEAIKICAKELAIEAGLYLSGKRKVPLLFDLSEQKREIEHTTTKKEEWKEV